MTNNALRALINEAASFSAITPALTALAAWTVVSFGVALKWFRWE